jgi:hypothetical protein
MMAIILDPYTIPEKGPVRLQVNRSFEIKVTAEEARRQVNRWVHNEVTYLMRGQPPTLVVGEQIVWRVPVSIGFPSVGQAGIVGMVDVDVKTGVMNTSPELGAGLIKEAEKIAQRLPPFQPHQLPPEYLAKNVPQAPELIVS